MARKHLKLYVFSTLFIAMSIPFSSTIKAELLPTAKSSSLHAGKYSDFKLEGNIRRFIGETLHIDISFLLFDNAATARVGFYEKNGVLYSILEAETKGFVGFFTGYRKHFYKATFDVVDKESRLRSKTFERKVIIGDMVNATNHSFDYKNRTHKWKKFIGGKLVEDGSRIIPPDVNFDDILAVFYNFRNSAYGKIQRGVKYTIYTVPEKEAKKIHVHIIDRDEQNDFMSKNNRTNDDEFLLKAIIPKEIFHTDTGELLFWSSEHLIPLETTVKDYILFGDLHAKLSHRVFKLPANDAAVPSFENGSPN